jgi:post-segregation antitoxin (ccd killing protein)
MAIARGIRNYEEALKRTRKRNVTLYIDADLVNRARTLGINLSVLTENVLKVYIPEVKKKSR